MLLATTSNPDSERRGLSLSLLYSGKRCEVAYAFSMRPMQRLLRIHGKTI